MKVGQHMNGKLTWVIFGIVMGLAGWTGNIVYDRVVADIVEVAFAANLNDVRLTKLETRHEIEKQWRRAIAANLNTIMDALEIPETHRAYVNGGD